ncbi:MAG: hypothetical protein IT349_05215, partial [Candidatus Eisenbacteria bacterium]|nr:hypothetical protein [Candidatus Eisenbacteria bacterium]
MRFFYTRSTTRQIVARTSRIFGFCAALAALGAAPGPLAWAGPNAGGVLLFHAAEQIAYCQDTQSYCGLSGQPGCEEVDARVNGQTTRVWFALAAFPDGASPRVKALSFGVEYESSGVTLVAQGSCADFEITTSQWPNSGEGTAITWNTAKTSAVTEAYWFAGYNYYAPDPTTFALRSHPTQGGNFADDSVPALLDPIADYGRLGFDQEGYVPCSVPPPQTGACCAADGSCSVLSASGCAQAGGVYQGDETVCEPNPCPPAGACCAADTGCQVLTSELCALAGGIWQGAGSGCDPNPCLDIPAACCLSSGACVVLSATDCASAGGVYQGIGSECGAGACPPGGACCADDGSCVVKLASDCFDAYQGDGSSCDPNPCAQPCPGVAEGGGESELPEVYPSSNLFGRRGDGGANQGGVLLMHSNPSLTYTDGAGPFCGDSGLDDCALANNRHDGSDARVIHVLAAFPLRSFPRLIGLTFGLRRTDCAVIEAWGSCGDFEIATDGWPGNNQGTAVAWDEAQTGLMTEVYWFAAYAYDGREATLGLRTHPTQGLYFADDQVPAILDPVVAVSGFGFNISNGDPVCPAPLPPAGACCLPSGDCAFLTPAACSTSGGAYQGDDVACQPDLCPPGGACCAPEGNCTILTSDACALAEGIWIGGESVCDPNPCLALEGACCLPSGGCEIRSVADCHAQGGVFQGIGSDCSEVICPPVGACCFVDGHCVLSFGPDCLGVYQGDGTACDPNPCPQPCPGFSGGGSEARGSETMPPIAGAQRGNGGPNEGGVLIMHSNPDLTFTDGGGSYCGQSQLTDCEEAINRYDGQDSRIIHVLAAFPFRSHPRMAGVTFGLRRT